MAGPLGLDAKALLEEWSARVRANREQAERFQEPTEQRDFYAPVAASFKADPRRTDEPLLDQLRALVRPGERWLDIGAGGGRYALPLAVAGAKVTALDPSPGMLAVLTGAAAEFQVEGVTTVAGRWPVQSELTCDVSLMAHVGYDIEELGPFLDAMERSSRRLCVAVLLGEAPASPAAAVWPAVHGEQRHLLPALAEFLAVLLARGKMFSVWLGERRPGGYPSFEAIEGFVRQQLFIQPDSPKVGAMRSALEQAVQLREGKYYLATEPIPLGLVTWTP